MLVDKIKNFIGRVQCMFSSRFMKSVSDVAKNENFISDKMMNAIDTWSEMFAHSPEIDSDEKTLGLPAAISSIVARLVTLEMKMSVTGSPMADFINEQLKNVIHDIRESTEYACASGGLVFKPYICNHYPQLKGKSKKHKKEIKSRTKYHLTK